MRITAKRSARAFMLLDCMIYITLFFLILGMAFAAFYQVMEHSKRLNRSTADISRALKAGEQWRADVRAAIAAPRILPSAPEPTLVIPQKDRDITYAFREGAIFRRAGAQAPWLEFLPGVETSVMQSDQKKQVRSWRWELELKAAKNKVYTKPLFTFQAVAPSDQKP